MTIFWGFATLSTFEPTRGGVDLWIGIDLDCCKAAGEVDSVDLERADWPSPDWRVDLGGQPSINPHQPKRQNRGSMPQHLTHN